MTDATMTFTANVRGKTKDELDQKARAEAAEFFGTDRLTIEAFDVVASRNSNGGRVYDAAVVLSEAPLHPTL